MTVTAHCAAPRHDGQDEPASAEPQAALCRPCRLSLAADLRRLPALHADLEHIPAQSGGDGSGLPFSEPAADCRSQIRHDVTYWAREFTRIRGDDAPPVQGGGWSERPVAVMCGWLEPQVTWCSFRDWAPDMAGAIGADRARAVALLDPFITKKFPVPGPDGVCALCGAGRMHAVVYAMESDRRRSYIECDGCGERLEPERWMRYGRMVIRRRDLQETAVVQRSQNAP